MNTQEPEEQEQRDSSSSYSHYSGSFGRGHGMEAIEIGLDYPFARSGILTPPTMRVHIDTGRDRGTPRAYMEVVFVLCGSRIEAAHTWGLELQEYLEQLEHHWDVQATLGIREKP